MNSLRLIFVTSLLSCFCCTPNISADWKDDIDYVRLVGERGTVEDGTGILLSQVEYDSDDDPNTFTYMPDVDSFALKTIVDATGMSSGTFSGHSNWIANIMFGNDGIAQGANHLTVYEARDFLHRVLGHDPSTGANTDPLPQLFQVQNHSWIDNINPTSAVNLLQRLDYVIDQDQVSIAVALNNGSGPVQPQLLGQAYNVISVGVSDGGHSRGQTTIYGSGRIMPNVVIPASFTSNATARVSSVLTVLHEKALNLGNADASRPEVMKAILMAGATKDEFSAWMRTTTQPVDTVFGAGEVNIYNSYHILEGGETDGSTTVPDSGTIGPYGWDYGESIDPSAPLYYNIEVVYGFDELSVMLNWNMDVTDTDDSGSFNAATSLADMSLRLYDSSLAPMGTLLDESLSPVDNFEHIFFKGLGPGLYTIEVSTNQTTDFALAWRADGVPEPGHLVATGFLGILFLVCYRRRKSSADRVLMSR